MKLLVLLSATLLPACASGTSAMAFPPSMAVAYHDLRLDTAADRAKLVRRVDREAAPDGRRPQAAHILIREQDFAAGLTRQRGQRRGKVRSNLTTASCALAGRITMPAGVVTAPSGAAHSAFSEIVILPSHCRMLRR